ncbi:leucine-rich repeat-containing G-protein coupled receptor 4-like [Ruditapes philippinarum]|uniref:leucine-rich repeat-containing G-protein coupled receptor 4-like n=1 Tax=Ruditapes philippinarum TaxID=129788 RepID=UPI00295B15C7|nr:leucine-rich repeat-containing G-protein coupled receptor 4-like [Ruditapes philippinarum]XP_060583818.1 leucine-rich repeat-containing G-protein coupled receptor 4-like [Ruditapes philippinarum]
MLVAQLLVWLNSAITLSALFTCPEMTNCACGEETDWWLNEWTNVKVVNCSYRALTRIPNLSLLTDTPFHRLLLNNNNITDIRRDDFKNISVKEIVLRKNPMKRIPHDSFQEVRHVLEILDLDSDRITIDEGLRFLHGLYKLKVLDLGYNRLKNEYDEFPSEVFANANLSSLTTLTLQALQTTKIHDGAFSGIENLEQLDLSYNFISDFPSELRKLKNLQGLKLYSNELTSIKNNTFAGLKKLKKLLIGVNEITADSIELGAFNDLADSIEEINFYQNPLMRVPSEVLQNLKNLKKLSLVKTNLESVENGSFVGDYKLEELHLDDNPKLRFEDDGSLNGIEDSLQVLFIRRLNLDALPLNVLGRLGSLYYLDGAENLFTKIDKHFFNGLNLSNIKLMWNKIKHVDHRAFMKMDKGVILDLHGNDIHDVSFILQNEECFFQEVYLTKNKIPCDCSVEKVINSGVVSWQVIGECYVETSGSKRWYSFDDTKLMGHFGKVCNKTRTYSKCFQSTSGSGRQCLFNLIYFFICVILSRTILKI